MKQTLSIIFFLCAAVLTLVWSTFPLPNAQNRVQALPVRGLGFSSRDVPLEPEEVTVFGAARVMKRIYQVGDQRCVVTAVDGNENQHAIHDPLYCFRGAGWTVLTQSIVLVPGGTAKRVRLIRGKEKQEAFFWISDDETRHAEPLLYWWQRTMRRLSFGRSGAEPIMVILQPLSGRLDLDKFSTTFPSIFHL